jgi:hypothetical protein
MGSFQQAADSAPRPLSRIDTDISTVKEQTARLEIVAERIIRHARSLGYYEPTPANTATPTPVVTTLADALKELDRVVERCSGSLNVFD